MPTQLDKDKPDYSSGLGWYFYNAHGEWYCHCGYVTKIWLNFVGHFEFKELK